MHTHTQDIYTRRRSTRRHTIAPLVAAAGTLLYALTFAAGAAHAQGGGGGAGAVGTKIETAATNLATLGRPFALLGVTLIVLSVIFEPALPEWARENKRLLRGILIACIVLGIIPDIVGFFLA